MHDDVVSCAVLVIVYNMNTVAREVHSGFKWQIMGECSGVVTPFIFLRVVHRLCVESADQVDLCWEAISVPLRPREIPGANAGPYQA